MKHYQIFQNFVKISCYKNFEHFNIFHSTASMFKKQTKTAKITLQAYLVAAKYDSHFQIFQILYVLYFFSQENTCVRVSFLISKKETQTQMFSCKICEISENTFYYKTPLVAPSNPFNLWHREFQDGASSYIFI